MEIRPADDGHRDAIRDVARRSFRTSYSLSPEGIESIVEEEFADGVLADRTDDPDVVVLVAVDDGDVLGFADAEAGDEGVLRWLHVDPDARGAGVGTALMERVREELTDCGLPFRARVLDEASEGTSFLERFDLRRTDSVQVEYGGETFHDHVYEPGERSRDPTEPAVEVPTSVTVDDRTLPVGRTDPIPGDEAPFFPVSADAADERYGFFCSNCGSTDVSADGLDRLACGECGNTHRADEWDGAYL